MATSNSTLVQLLIHQPFSKASFGRMYMIYELNYTFNSSPECSKIEPFFYFCSRQSLSQSSMMIAVGHCVAGGFLSAPSFHRESYYDFRYANQPIAHYGQTSVGLVRIVQSSRRQGWPRRGH